MDDFVILIKLIVAVCGTMASAKLCVTYARQLGLL
jgi:hypothetical protein